MKPLRCILGFHKWHNDKQKVFGTKENFVICAPTKTCVKCRTIKLQNSFIIQPTKEIKELMEKFS